jgi:hypothetical protein
MLEEVPEQWPARSRVSVRRETHGVLIPGFPGERCASGFGGSTDHYADLHAPRVFDRGAVHDALACGVYPVISERREGRVMVGVHDQAPVVVVLVVVVVVVVVVYSVPAGSFTRAAPVAFSSTMS